MSWFFIALWAPFLLACANHNDKFLLSRYLKKKTIGSIVILSSLFSGVALPIVLFFQPDVNDVSSRSRVCACRDRDVERPRRCLLSLRARHG